MPTGTIRRASRGSAGGPPGVSSQRGRAHTGRNADTDHAARGTCRPERYSDLAPGRTGRAGLVHVADTGTSGRERETRPGRGLRGARVAVAPRVVPCGLSFEPVC